MEFIAWAWILNILLHTIYVPSQFFLVCIEWWVQIHSLCFRHRREKYQQLHIYMNWHVWKLIWIVDFWTNALSISFQYQILRKITGSSGHSEWIRARSHLNIAIGPLLFHWNVWIVRSNRILIAWSSIESRKNEKSWTSIVCEYKMTQLDCSSIAKLIIRIRWN